MAVTYEEHVSYLDHLVEEAFSGSKGSEHDRACEAIAAALAHLDMAMGPELWHRLEYAQKEMETMRLLRDAFLHGNDLANLSEPGAYDMVRSFECHLLMSHIHDADGQKVEPYFHVDGTRVHVYGGAVTRVRDLSLELVTRSSP